MRATINARGPVSIEDFMAQALWAPEGYYRHASPIGADGDFITAPEVAQTFGEIMGLWLAEAWQRLGSPSFTFAEFGPGRGTFLLDALRALAVVPGMLQAMDLRLCEINPALKAIQHERLQAFQPQWFSAIEELPPRPLIFFANEFLDCFPLHQLVRHQGRWRVRGVDVCPRTQALVFTLLPQEHEFQGLPMDSSEGTLVEINPQACAWARRLGGHLNRYGGAGLLVDYGTATTACGDTLQAVHRHRKVSPLCHYGDSDLTAHVRFAPVARALEAEGVTVYGCMEQGSFLKACGIEQRTRTLAQSSENADSLRAGLERLTAPSRLGASDGGGNMGGMGSLFKVLAAGQRDAEPA